MAFDSIINYKVIKQSLELGYTVDVLKLRYRV